MRRPSRRSGAALILVVIGMTATLAAWSLASRRTHDLVRLKEGLERRQMTGLFDPGRCRLRALAYGLALLETGDPPAELMTGDPLRYRCNVVVRRPGASDLVFTLGFEPAGEREWIVTAEPAVDFTLPGPGGFVAPARD